MARTAARKGTPLCLATAIASRANAPVEADDDTTVVVALEALQLLWSAGDAAEHLGVVCTGRLVATRQHARQKLIFDVLRPGDIVGAQALGERHQFDVSSLRRSVVVLVPISAMRRRVAQRPEFALRLLDRYAETLKRMSSRVESLSSGSVEQRLADVILGLVERFGEPFPGGTLVPLKLRREDLAAMAATTQESISRRLAQWQRAGILALQPAGYLVRDAPALKQLLERA